MTIVFQTLTMDACAAVQAVALAAWLATYQTIFDTVTIHNFVAKYYAVEHLQSLVESATRQDIYFETVAEDDSVIGFCHIGVQQGEGHLFRVYLRPGVHGRRLGSTFLERGESWL